MFMLGSFGWTRIIGRNRNSGRLKELDELDEIVEDWKNWRFSETNIVGK